jgi:hypothetical protein
MNTGGKKRLQAHRIGSAKVKAQRSPLQIFFLSGHPSRSLGSREQMRWAQHPSSMTRLEPQRASKEFDTDHLKSDELKRLCQRRIQVSRTLFGETLESSSGEAFWEVQY